MRMRRILFLNLLNLIWRKSEAGMIQAADKCYLEGEESKKERKICKCCFFS